MLLRNKKTTGKINLNVQYVFNIVLADIATSSLILQVFDVEAVAQRFSVKRMFLKTFQNSRENTGVSFFIKPLALNSETPEQVFSRKFCEFFKGSYFVEHV